jgi:3-deoxy-D-manno-octulosonic-acid transferase
LKNVINHDIKRCIFFYFLIFYRNWRTFDEKLGHFIMHFLYTLSLWGYHFLIRFAAFFHSKARKWVEGRAIIDNVLMIIQHDKKQTTDWKLAWFHCASLGEFEQGRPVVEAFKNAFPDHKILLTFFSPSGYEIRKNYASADYITYLPLDLQPNVEHFLEITQPTIAFFVKYEFWRNFIIEAKKRSIELYSFSTIFREKQIYFRSYGGYFKEILHAFRHIFVQDEISKNLLQSIDYQEITKTGDTRFDRVQQIANAVKTIPFIENFKDNKQLLVVGSAWANDMACVSQVINQKLPELKYIIAPHEIDVPQIQKWQSQLSISSIRYSEITETTDLKQISVLFIDNIGMLSSLYQYASYAFIGGGFGKGLHNILEAATFGCPIFFGNKAYHKFKEANDLLALGGAFAVTSGQNFDEIFRKILPNKSFIGRINSNYVLENVGATEKIIAYIAQKN